MKRALPTLVASILFICLLFGCASPLGNAVVPGQSTLRNVEAAIGPPAARLDLPGGGTTYFYSRQPLGRETYAVRFSREGVVTTVEPLFTAANFGKLRVNETSGSAIRELLGPPYRIERMPRQARDAWEYWTNLDAVPTRVWLLLSDDAVLREVVKIDESPRNEVCSQPGC